MSVAVTLFCFELCVDSAMLGAVVLEVCEEDVAFRKASAKLSTPPELWSDAVVRPTAMLLVLRMMIDLTAILLVLGMLVDSTLSELSPRPAAM